MKLLAIAGVTTCVCLIAGCGDWLSGENGPRVSLRPLVASGAATPYDSVVTTRMEQTAPRTLVLESEMTMSSGGYVLSAEVSTSRDTLLVVVGGREEGIGTAAFARYRYEATVTGIPPGQYRVILRHTVGIPVRPRLDTLVTVQ